MESSPSTTTGRSVPGKLKMVECKAMLGCSEKEWSEIGAILLEITKEYNLSATSWSDQKYETATNAAINRAPLLKDFLSRIPKDERFKFELVKRMITVKAKKQTELEMKRKHKSEADTMDRDVKRVAGEKRGAGGGGKQATSTTAAAEVTSIESGSRSPDDHAPISPKSSPIPPYAFRYLPTAKQVIPEPYHHGRGISVLSPQSAQSNPSDISDIFLAQTYQYVQSFRSMQETLRRQEGEIYALRSKVIELERQLNASRRPDLPLPAVNGVDHQRRPYRR